MNPHNLFALAMLLATEFDEDLLDCETRAAPIYPPLRASEFVGRCLKAKGWRPQ